MNNRDRYDTWERRSETFADKFTERPVWTSIKVLVVVLVVVFILGLVGRWLGFVNLWVDKTAEVAGPANVSKQFTEVGQDWQDLIAAAEKVCVAQASSTAGPNDPTFLEDPLTAMKQVYFTVQADFNRRQQNIFEAGKVGPPGYPDTVPVIKETTSPTGDWCAVAPQLRAIHP